MSQPADLSEAQRFLTSQPNTQSIEVLLPDLHGVLRGKRVAPELIVDIFTHGLCLPASLFGASITGDTVEATGLGFESGDADRVCRPVVGSLVPIPWLQRPAAQLLLSMYENDTTPFALDPQHQLSSVTERFRPLGLRPQAAIELEFYLIDRERDGCGAPQPPRSAFPAARESATQAYGVEQLETHRALFDAISEAARLQQIPVAGVVAEYAPGQYEINLHHQTDVLLACRHAVLLKRLVKALATQHGLEATFMAKPYRDQPGSGMHVHISLLDEHDHNVFRDDRSHTGSETLHHAVGGLLASLNESMLLFAPNANSYRRFQSDSFVPVTHSWGWNNRTVAVRIPAGDHQAARLEHRVAGADANPFLVCAALLAGIHHGIVSRIDPGDPVVGNADVNRLPPLPHEWSIAIEHFRQREILGEYLDDRACDVLLACKQDELARFRGHVSPLEYEWYLRLV